MMTKTPSSSKKNQKIRIKTENPSSKSSPSPRSIGKRRKKLEKKKQPNEFVMQYNIQTAAKKNKKRLDSNSSVKKKQKPS
jgi:hypothetical protein